MIEVTKGENCERILKHHQDFCIAKESEDPNFDIKAKLRAYQIWETTHCQDERTNYFKAIEELRSTICDCEEYSKQYPLSMDNEDHNQSQSDNKVNEEIAMPSMTSIEEEESKEKEKEKEKENKSMSEEGDTKHEDEDHSHADEKQKEPEEEVSEEKQSETEHNQETQEIQEPLMQISNMIN